MIIVRRFFASAAAAAVLWTSPGLGCFEALAQTRAAPLPEALSGVFLGLESGAASPAFPVYFESVCGALASRLEQLERLPSPEQRRAYLSRSLEQASSGPLAVSAKLLSAVEERPDLAPAAFERLRGLAARAGVRSASLSAVARRWTTVADGGVASVDPKGLKLLSRASLGRWNAFHADYFDQPAFVKINAPTSEVEAQWRANRLPLPDNVDVPKVLAAGRPGLRELAQVGNAHALPTRDVAYYAFKGSRVLVMESRSEAVSCRMAPAPVAEADARGLSEAIEIVHESGMVHGDLKPENIRLRQDGGRSRFTLIDWERAAPATTVEVRREKDYIVRLVERLLRGKGSLDSVSIPSPADPEPEPPPAGSPLRRGAIIAGVIAALTFLPSLAAAEPLRHWRMFGPAGWDFTPFAFPRHPLLIAGLGAALGWLNLRFSSWVQSLHHWVIKGKSATAERILRSSPFNPFILAELGLLAFLEELGFRVMAYDMVAGWIGPFLPAALVYPLTALAVSAFFTRGHRFGPVWTRFVGGLGYMAAYLLTGAIWLPFLMHFFNNYFYFLGHRAKGPSK